MDYTIQRSVAADFDDVVAATTAALEDEGFGVLSDIDMGATLTEKLGVEFRQYRVLGACRPAVAHEGLTEEIDLGALLPCNVVVYEGDDGDVVVSAVDPQQLVAVTGNDDLDGIAADARDRFERALDAVADEFGATTEA